MIRSAAPMWSVVLFVVVLGIVLRCGAMVQVNAPRLRTGEETSIAQHLAAGRGFSFAEHSCFGPTSIRPPVYPVLQAVAFAALGAESPAATLLMLTINALAGGVSVVLAFAVGKRLFQSERAALFTCLLVAILPTQLYAASFQQGLSIAVMLLLATLWLVLNRDIRLALPAGLVAGLMLLTESVLATPVAFVVAWIASRRAGYALLLLTATFALLVPWLHRNAIVHQQPTGITNTLWSDTFTGNGPNATGSAHLHRNASPLAHVSPIDADKLKRQPERVRMRLFRDWSIDWISNHPVLFARLCAQRLLKTVWLDWDHPAGLNPLNVFSRTVCFVGWIAALVVMIRHRQFEPLTIALSAGLIVATVFTLAEARNSVFMDIPQLLAIAWLIDRRAA
jgi:hypothetical protein